MARRQQHFDNLDAAENAFFDNALEQVRTRVYEARYPQLMARNLIPVDTSVPPGTKILLFRQYDSVGLAKIVAAYSDDLPRADSYSTEDSAKIKVLGDSYGFSVVEIGAAARAGTPLEQRKANAARKAMEELVERIAQKGDADHGLKGLLNQPNALNYVIPNGAAASPLWKNKTPDEILKDLGGMSRLAPITTKNAERQDTLLLPDEQYALIAETRLGANSETTILQFFLKVNPYIRTVQPWSALKGSGAAATDRAVVYRRDPDALGLVIPREFEQLPGQPRGLEIVVPCLAECGGVVLYLPMSLTYADGI